MEIIKSSTDISFVFQHGKRLNGSLITLLVYKASTAHDPRGRVAFVAGKKNGNAVWRNSAKRRMRAIAHELGAPWRGFDVVFVAKRATTEAMYSKVLRQASDLIQDVLKDSDL